MSWIDIKEDLPDPYDFVLICATPPGDEPYAIAIARLKVTGGWDFLDYDTPDEERLGAYMDMTWPFRLEYISHWMPLPKPPGRNHDN